MKHNTITKVVAERLDGFALIICSGDTKEEAEAKIDAIISQRKSKRVRTEEELDHLQKQLRELVIDISIRKDSKTLCGYDISKCGNNMFVWMMSRDEPFMSFTDGVEWFISFDKNFNDKTFNDCITSLACVLTDLENGL